MNNTFDVEQFLDRDRLAVTIANNWTEWQGLRKEWESEKRELRNYIFATDTTKTTNASLPWKNKTTLPKLTQIRDNLHANYMAALFPNDEWLSWSGDDEDSVAMDKRKAIEFYMKNKLNNSGFRNTISKLILDYIDYGNSYSGITYVNESKSDPITGEVIQGYVGPRLYRISPFDIVFNPTTASFEESPKIIRSIKSLGELKKNVLNNPELGYSQEVIDRILNNRKAYTQLDPSDRAKSEGFSVDGFGSIEQYYNSGYVELLEFQGDIYDQDTDTLYEDHIITVIDRSYIVRLEPNKSWLGEGYIRHVGWRTRPDNLLAMGPLDNLVGMQYRIDHLENLKADVFDLIAHPVMKIRGYVEDFEYGPGERIYAGDDGDVDFMRPDTTALSADMQIRELENKMEEFAGAPKQAMGIRTPGEKTAYEVQALENAAGRTFQNKITHFEELFIEPQINAMFEMSRRHLDGADIIRVMDDDFGVASFLTVTKEDITARGKLYPRGARHFAKQAQLIQNLTQFANSSIGQDPAVNVHISGKRMAQLAEELLGVDKFGLVQENVRIMEQQETQRIMQSAQQQLQQEQMMDVDQSEEEEQIILQQQGAI